MEILIQSPHEFIPVDAEVDLYERFEKLKHLNPGILFCDVVLSREHHTPQTYGVHARLSVRGEDLFAKEYGNSYLHAARLVISDLENQIRKVKEKRTHHVEPIDLGEGPEKQEKPQGEQ